MAIMDNAARRRQKNYRTLLEAMGRPGSLARLQALEGGSPFAAAMAIGECLLDHEVSLCVTGKGAVQALREALVSATRARNESLGSADFVFVLGVDGRGDAQGAKRGRLESPEEGATLVYCMDSQSGNAAEPFGTHLAGPGIDAQGGTVPELRGIPTEKFQELMEVNADYPLGVDAFFIRPNGELMALPRSTRIRVR